MEVTPESEAALEPQGFQKFKAWGGVAISLWPWESGAADELPVGSQASKERGRRVGLRELVLLLSKLTWLWGAAGCLGDTPIPETLGMKVSFPQC